MEVRSHFDEELKKLEDKVVELIDLTKDALTSTVEALETSDAEKAHRVIRRDAVINALEEQINDDAVLVIVKQSPVAIDLRTVITSIKVANDIERIADYAVNIAKYVSFGKLTSKVYVGYITELTELVLKMLEDIKHAYVDRDHLAAIAISESDEILDKRYKEITKALIKDVKADVNENEEAMYAMLLVKQLERAGDHVTNISENIIYMVKGRKVDLN